MRGGGGLLSESKVRGWERGELGLTGGRAAFLCPYLLSWGGVENPLKVNCALLMTADR